MHSGYIPDFVLPAASIHSHNTPYASDQNLYRIHIRTNYGKFTFKYKAALIWETIPKDLELKSLNSSSSETQGHSVESGERA